MNTPAPNDGTTWRDRWPGHFPTWTTLLPCAIAIAAGNSGCQEVDAGQPWSFAAPVTVASHNMANVAGGPDAIRIADALHLQAPDFIAAQEFGDDNGILALLGEAYALTAAPASGVALLYDSIRWNLLDTADLALGVNDDGWGARIARWGLFERADGGQRIWVYSTHWCVSIREPDDACDEDRQVTYADTLIADVAGLPTSEPVVIGGDFNVFDGFQNGAPMMRLRDAGLVDVLAEAGEDAPTFMGNEWAPPGRIDYILASSDVVAHDASLANDTANPGSDHYLLTATLGFE